MIRTWLIIGLLSWLGLCLYMAIFWFTYALFVWLDFCLHMTAL